MCSGENCLCCVVFHQRTYYIGYNFYIWASAETTDLWVMKLRIFRLFPIGLAFLVRGLLRYSSTFATKFCWLRQQRADVLSRIFCAMLLGVSYFCQTLSGTLFRLKMQNFQKWCTYLLLDDDFAWIHLSCHILLLFGFYKLDKKRIWCELNFSVLCDDLLMCNFT